MCYFEIFLKCLCYLNISTLTYSHSTLFFSSTGVVPVKPDKFTDRLPSAGDVILAHVKPDITCWSAALGRLAWFRFMPYLNRYSTDIQLPDFLSFRQYILSHSCSQTHIHTLHSFSTSTWHSLQVMQRVDEQLIVGLCEWPRQLGVLYSCSVFVGWHDFARYFLPSSRYI